FGLWLVDDAVLVLTDELPRPGRPADATFGETLALEGYDVAPVDAGARVRLAWRVLRSPAGDPVRRLDLVASDGAVLASRWGPATSEYLPATRWAKGQRVLEEVTLPLEPAARPALTRLRIGWADRGSGERLALADGAAALAP